MDRTWEEPFHEMLDGVFAFLGGTWPADGSLTQYLEKTAGLATDPTWEIRRAVVAANLRRRRAVHEEATGKSRTSVASITEALKGTPLDPLPS